MNRSIISKSLLIALPMLALGACSSNSDVDAESAEKNATQAVEQVVDDVQTNTIEAIELTAEEQLAQLYTDAILKTTIRFEFDKSLIMPDYAMILDAHAKYLVNNTDKTITIEGHADELGTPEYNIALGERRALAVSTYLENMGVAASQITVVSYGEEKPVNLGHTKMARIENRRAELVY
ncbi:MULTISPECIES: peptidoglycan-associated lipoprotein Pal [Psychromonas]|uniref:peptidoglycan-associated lipoprotein Pal n=1 Tax=Psychromonas TaxID=67572 RepID=UPI0003F4EAAE|nr:MULTISPECIES: peptidoglycan-associated lipoprotein Pal [Psychromonas]MBB1271711.1 peptidoglycan-associated lipoprotein Pal [Psychromonas sp. SR45-3]